MQTPARRGVTSLLPLSLLPSRDGAAARSGGWQRGLVVALLLMAAVFVGLRFLHLQADFPNGSPWTDWAKYTDEGWYGDAAIRHYLRGTWHLPGDFNPAAALPVWPLLEAVLFRFTGVGIVAARALTVVVFGGILLCGFVLLRGGAADPVDVEDRALAARGGAVSGGALPSWTTVCAAVAVLLLAVSPYFYAFSRMAVLEPLLVLLTLVALLLARAAARHPGRRGALLAVAVGLVVTLMVGTKTTAVALVPAVAFALVMGAGWPPGRWRAARSSGGGHTALHGAWRAAVRRLLLAGGVALLLCGGYYGWLVRAHYLDDFRYLFSANSYTGLTATNAAETVRAAFLDFGWMGHGTAALLVVSLVWAVVCRWAWRRVWRDPVVVALLLWIAGYLAFLIYHANLQPRYYLVVAVPSVLLTWRLLAHAVAWRGWLAWLLVPAVVATVMVEARATLGYVRHPEYTFREAAREVEAVVEAEPSHSHTVLSISGSDLSLMTGLPSICDDFGTMELEDRIAAYKPGWFLAWNYVEDDKMEALAKFYRLSRVRAIPAMDDPDRNLLILYRLDPKEGARPKRRRSRRG